jgi:hypothetical protein
MIAQTMTGTSKMRASVIKFGILKISPRQMRLAFGDPARHPLLTV